MVYVRKLRAVGAGFTHLGLLDGQRSHMLLLQGNPLRWKRASCQTALSAVVAHTGVVYDVDAVRIRVVNVRRIYAGHVSVVPE